MFDTVYMWLDWSKVDNVELDSIASKLSNLKEFKSKSSVSYSGYLDNYVVRICEAGISLKGSIARYYHGNNLFPLSRLEMKDAVKKLSDELGLPFHLSKVTRFDLAANFIMERPVQNYFPFLGEKRGYNRSNISLSTLYYNTEKKQLIFYDKSKEFKKKYKSVETPFIYKEKNILRYELKYQNRVNKIFDKEEITVEDLINVEFYEKLKENYINEYIKIQKVNRISILNYNEIRKPKHALNLIFGALLHKTDPEDINSILDELKVQKVFSDPKSYSRLKSDLRDIKNSPTISVKSDLIIELDKKVTSIRKCYLI